MVKAGYEGLRQGLAAVYSALPTPGDRLMSLPKVIFSTGVHMSVVHESNTPPHYVVLDRGEVACTCDNEDRAIAIARALAVTALLWDATVGIHQREQHR